MGPIGCAETSINDQQHSTRYVTAQDSEDLIYTSAAAWNLALYTGNLDPGDYLLMEGAGSSETLVTYTNLHDVIP
jgi:hypothetical protein